MSITAAVLALGFGQRGAAYVVLALLAIGAFLESAFALCLGCKIFCLGCKIFCLGCKIFAALMRVGIVPSSVCEQCADISRRYPTPGATQAP